MTLADRRPVARRRSARPQRRRSTSRDEAATARLLEGHDAVLNCVTYYFNVPVMRAALAARVPYTDLGGLYHGSLKQFALDERLPPGRSPGASLGMGSTPGITNVMAGALARRPRRRRRASTCASAASTARPAGPLPVPYALDTVLDEFSLEPMVFRGRVARKPSRR